MVTTAHSKADVVIRKVVGEVDGAANGNDEILTTWKYGKGFGSVSAMVPLGIGMNTITIEVDPVTALLNDG